MTQVRYLLKTVVGAVMGRGGVFAQIKEEVKVIGHSLGVLCHSHDSLLEKERYL